MQAKTSKLAWLLLLTASLALAGCVQEQETAPDDDDTTVVAPENGDDDDVNVDVPEDVDVRVEQENGGNSEG